MKPIIPFVHRITENEEARWISELNAHWPGCEVRPLRQLSNAQIDAASVAIVANPDPEDLNQLPNLKWVHSLWAGVENLVQHWHRTDIPIVRMKDPALATTMAEAVLTWALFLQRNMHRYARQQKHNQWLALDYQPMSDCTVGIIGLGKLGMATAAALNAQGFKTIGWSQSEKHIDFMPSFQGRDGLKTVVEQSDIVVVLLPLTAETNGLFDTTMFSAMKANAHLINFARGPIVEVESLLNFLNNNPNSHAVLDVFDQEPLPPETPLWQHPSVSVLPHITAPTLPESAAKIAIENVKRYFETDMIPGAIDRVKGY
ncbi:2-hydroxyacid dehydrogenase [Reinekea marinisedimentorum]|uniref:Glyoxylate/hydroxypyruvate reductase A n=1 Tax=Reinekea marinisedimentorum TaxID=230495 RepID=A0A4V2UKE4_9GAMM|nr:glyoxylate/hydroxypyruvate reductase A [Reinekea marinisedimentorum]TCS44033.1 glyoxylate/hydroxypyruvate reductase A [Reinekea marinisedimentorum]